jgi:hypothetical protein
MADQYCMGSMTAQESTEYRRPWTGPNNAKSFYLQGLPNLQIFLVCDLSHPYKYECTAGCGELLKLLDRAVTLEIHPTAACASAPIGDCP